MEPTPESPTEPKPDNTRIMVPPALRDLEDFALKLEEWKDRIFVREQLDGRWDSISLTTLDELAPLRGAYWRGVLSERYRMAGVLPVVVPVEDLEVLAADRPVVEAPDGPVAESDT